MVFEPWQLLAAAGLLLALAEFFTPTFFSLPAGLAFIATAILAAFIDDWTVLYICLAINLGVVYALFHRFVWPKVRTKESKTNADGMAGKIAVVCEAVDPASGAGEVKLYGDRFRVVSTQAFAEGSRVMITATEGNKLVIRELVEGEG